jgi:hypothetical protein
MEIAAMEPGSVAERLLSYTDDLDGTFDVSIDHDVNAQVSSRAQRLMSTCRSPITSSCCSKVRFSPLPCLLDFIVRSNI